MKIDPVYYGQNNFQELINPASADAQADRDKGTERQEGKGEERPGEESCRDADAPFFPPCAADVFNA